MEETERWVRVGHATGAAGFDEIDRVAQHSSGAPVAGLYTYGEIARTHGISGSHNQTLVVLAVS